MDKYFNKIEFERIFKLSKINPFLAKRRNIPHINNANISTNYVNSNKYYNYNLFNNINNQNDKNNKY